jgi:hypothetical protein
VREVLEVNSNSFDRPNSQTNKVEVGEIRRLASNPNEFNINDDEKLVVIIETHEYLDGTATVALVDGLVELATDRDFLLPPDVTSAPFGLSLWVDFTARVLIEQLQDSPVFGLVDPKKLKFTSNLASVAPNGSLYEYKEKFPFELGKYVPFFGDNVWLRRSNEMDSLNELSVSLDSDETMKRFLKINHQQMQVSTLNQVRVNGLRDAHILIELNVEHSRAVLV